MRTDEAGNSCPETLGEYRDLVMALCGDENNPAVKFLDRKIADQGRDEKVMAPDGQMRMILIPLMMGDLPGEPEGDGSRTR